MVVASEVFWWLTETGAEVVPNLAIAERGTIVSAVVLTALPVDAFRTARSGATGGLEQVVLLTGGAAVIGFVVETLGNVTEGVALLVVTAVVGEDFGTVGMMAVGLSPQAVEVAAAPAAPPDAIPVDPPPA